MSAWGKVGGRSRLQLRVYALVGLGVLLPLVVAMLASVSYSEEIKRQLLADREAWARTTAARLDELLRGDLEVLQSAALAPGINLEDADNAPENAALHEALLRFHNTDGVFFADAAGAIVASEPAHGPPPSVRPAIETALRSGRPTVTRAAPDGGTARRIVALVPLRSYKGKVTGVAGVALSPTLERFGRILGPRNRDALVSLVDSSGDIVAANDPGRDHDHGPHPTVFASIVAEHRTFAGACDSCHGNDRHGSRRDLSALAPLDTAPWAVRICGPENAAYTAARTFPGTLLRWSLPVLFLALVFAWGAGRSVRQPLDALTHAAERIAAGRMDEPIAWTEGDEIGRLSRALETMRTALRESLTRVEQANAGLEKRVEQRTRELERLYAELRERDQAHVGLLRKVITAQEDERRRIARELHDETSQSLAAVVMRCETGLAGLPEGPARQRLEDVKSIAVRTLDEVHRLVLDLRPSVLDDLGLESAIRWCAERHLKSAGVAARCEFELERRLPAEVETTLFRVAQEAITNIARHAQAESVLIQLREADGRATLEIEDDGRGFDVAAAGRPDARRPAFGVMGMRERIELLGGTLAIESAPGEGTRLAADVPLRTLPAEAATA